MVALASSRHRELEFVTDAGEHFVRDERFDYVILSDLVPYAFDLQAILQNIRAMTHERSRIVIHSYSQLWRPAIRLAEMLGLKPRKPISNWVTPDDLRNLLELADFEVVSISKRVLLPKKVPALSTFLNGVVANVWPLSHLSLTWWVVARPKPAHAKRELSVSVIVPCRNEAGIIAEIIERTPELGSSTELVFVEGGSSDGTREEIERQIDLHPERQISLARPDRRRQGRRRAARVRKSPERAVDDPGRRPDRRARGPRQVLPRHRRGACRLRQRLRLVYDLQSGAMQFLNLVGNKFFSTAFSYLLEQPVKDTLCGTKVLRKGEYEEIVRSRSYFGDFDPFGDFDLLLGAARRTMKIVDIPVRYGARRYGRTNISRSRHGVLLFQMAAMGFYKLKVKPVRLVSDARARRGT